MEGKKIMDGLGVDMYLHHCTSCGNGVSSWRRTEGNYTCTDCKEDKKHDANGMSKMKSDRTLEIAKIYLKRKKIISLYEIHFAVIEKNLDRKGWFQSSGEVLVALELLRNGIKARHQVRYGKWRVDFVIPDMKVVLEVDGEVYHQGSKKEKDKLRDAALVAHLGPEWEVVRIDAMVLNKSLKKLIPAIEKVVSERKRVRNNFNQKLPNWYSEKGI